MNSGMTDREFLAWIHERLELIHHENPHVDYMHALRAIILATPPDRRSVDTGSGNNSADMRERSTRWLERTIRVVWTCNASADNKRILTDAIVEEVGRSNAAPHTGAVAPSVQALVGSSDKEV